MAKKKKRPAKVKVDPYKHKKETVKGHKRDWPDPSSYPRKRKK
jgi:hypothetical protein